MKFVASSLAVIAIGAGSVQAQIPPKFPGSPIPPPAVPNSAPKSTAIPAQVPVPVTWPAAAVIPPPRQVPGAPFGNVTKGAPKVPKAPKSPKNGKGGPPDLGAIAASFPVGPQANSTLLKIRTAQGPYKVNVTMHPAFPNRTIYMPINVNRRTQVPIFSWGNGICYQYGGMYLGFLSEIASHGYLVIAPGEPMKHTGYTNATWQMNSITMAKRWRDAPFNIDTGMVAVGGHSCGGMETIKNLATDDYRQITTGIILNSAGKNESFDDIRAPMLWINGGQVDTEKQQDKNFQYIQENRRRLPVFEAALQTGHLGSFWHSRGGIYAETVKLWLDWQLKEDRRAGAFFRGGAKAGAIQRGWSVHSHAID